MGKAPTRTKLGGVLSPVTCCPVVAFLFTGYPLCLRPCQSLTVHTVGGARGVLQSVGCVYFFCLQSTVVPFCSLGHDIVSFVLVLVATAPQLMLGTNRVGSLTRDLWRRRAPQVLRRWDCLAEVQCETSPRPLWGNDGGWSRGTSAKLHCLTCDVSR